MSREDLVSALGTIASSGTRAFIDKVGGGGRRSGAPTGHSLIGQFGIGFYSAFMVADRVIVETRRAGYGGCLALDAATARAPTTSSRSHSTRPPPAAPGSSCHINAASDEFLETPIGSRA